MLNFQIGKKYRRRDGVIATCTSDKDFGIYQFDIGETYKPCYFPNGSQWNRHALTGHSSDIIEEVKENEMKIEVGKYYKTVSGDKAFIGYKIVKGANYPFVGHIENTNGEYYERAVWNKDGNSANRADYHLIEEWKELKKDIAYVNVFSGVHDGLSLSATFVPMKKSHNRIACIRVEWTEGQFDD